MNYRKRKGEKMEDKIKQPSHYKNGNKEVRVAIEDNFSLEETVGYYKGNIMKYVCRYEFKNGLEDIKKAQTYLEFLIELYNNETGEPLMSLQEDVAIHKELLRVPRDFISDKEYLVYLKTEVISDLVFIECFKFENSGMELVRLMTLLSEMEEILIKEEDKKYTINGDNQSVEPCGVLKLWV